VREQVICEFPRLAQIHLQHLRFALLESGPKETIHHNCRPLGHHPQVVSGIRQLEQSAADIPRFLWQTDGADPVDLLNA